MANLRLHSLNDVKIVGRLTRDPELRFTTQGTPVCRLRVAVGRRYKDRQSSEWKEEVAYIGATVWRESAERCGQRLKKGSPVFIEGRLRSKEWQTKEGQKRSELEVDALKIQFLEAYGDGGTRDAGTEESVTDSGSEEANGSMAMAGSSTDSAASKNLDEVPF